MSQTWIVVPCFNETARLDRSRFHQFCAAHPRYQLLFVNDGSRDDTGAMLDAMRLLSPRSMSVLHLDQNRGKAEAVRQGMLQAFDRDAAAVGFWDADLATPIEAAPQFQDVLDRRAGADIVLGTRLQLLGRSIERRRIRQKLGRLFARCASRVVGLPIYDTQCGAKLFRATEATRRLFTLPFASRWIFDVEILLRWRIERQLAGDVDPHAGLYELPVERWQEVKGSKLKSTDFLRAIGELWTIRRKYAGLRVGAGPQSPPAPPARRAA